MGLLGDSFDDPKTMATLALAGGLMGGRTFGQGLLGGLQSYQGSLLGAQQLQEAQQKSALEKFQLQRMQDWQAQWKAASGQDDTAQNAQATPPAAPPQIGTNSSIGDMPMFSSGVTSTPSAQPPQATTAPRQNVSPGGSMDIPGFSHAQSAVIAQQGPDAYAKAFLEKGGLQTDVQKSAWAAGYRPGTPQWNDAMTAGLTKATNIAPTALRGQAYWDPQSSSIKMLPSTAPEGYTNVPDPTAPGGFAVVESKGGPQAVQGSSASVALGKATAAPTVAYDATNKPVFSTQAIDVGRATGNPPAGSGLPVNDVNAGAREIARMQASLPNIADPASKALIQDEITRLKGQSAQYGTPSTVTPVPQMGAAEGAKLGQDELSSKGKSLMADSSQAQTVISRLQNIKMLAPGALTGAENSRRDFFNGLLSLAGVQKAEDAKTASDLVDKNSAQIVAALRMGQGGAGTDALQSLLGAGNPNRKMTLPAINDAVDQLIASQKMTQAKANLLQPHYLGRDPVAYGTAENTFDQNADPRIWQLESMPSTAQAAYVKSLPPAVAQDILNKRQALKQIGALK